MEFFGVREYHPGDSMRWLNHRASARFEQTLFVNEFEQERAVDVGLILDTRQVTNVFAGTSTILEYSIQATAKRESSIRLPGLGELFQNAIIGQVVKGPCRQNSIKVST